MVIMKKKKEPHEVATLVNGVDNSQGSEPQKMIISASGGWVGEVSKLQDECNSYQTRI